MDDESLRKLGEFRRWLKGFTADKYPGRVLPLMEIQIEVSSALRFYFPDLFLSVSVRAVLGGASAVMVTIGRVTWRGEGKAEQEWLDAYDALDRLEAAR